MRKKRLFLNTGTAIINQIISLICGFILPRLIISTYGSATNGLITSITDFLLFFSMMDMGVGAVVRSSLYKPLAEHDEDGVSRILISSRRFFTKIGLILCVYTVGLMIFFPVAIDHDLGYFATVVLVFSLALNSIASYMLGIVYEQLLTADQRTYVRLVIMTITTVLNTVFSVVLIEVGAPIHVVKLVAALVILLRPILLKAYVDRHYHLNFKIKLTEEPLKQKWNGLAQHIAQYIMGHTDTMVLTLMSTLDNVSIYGVYTLVTKGLQQMVDIVTTGVQALFGNMYANEEIEKLNRTFSAFEMILHAVVTLLYGLAGVLIIPFVRIYTAGITDVNYIVPAFAVLIILANASYCLRLPYNMMVLAAGHFKETQASAIIEASINIVVSVALVHWYGLVGVAIGTLVAMLYRSTYLAWYLKRAILHRSFRHFVQHMIIDAVSIVLVAAATNWIPMISQTWYGWLILAIEKGLIAAAIVGVINVIFYRSLIKDALDLLLRKKRKA